jgi:type IV secretory pathway VirB10-like protein
MKWMIAISCFLFFGLGNINAQSKKELNQNKRAEAAPEQVERVKKEVKQEEVNTPRPKTVKVEQATQPQVPEQHTTQPTPPVQPEQVPVAEEKKQMESELKGENDERVPAGTLKKKLKKKPTEAKK